MNGNIVVSEFDFNRLINLMKYYNVPKLEKELYRANIIKNILVLPDLVTLDTTLVYSIDKHIQCSTLVAAKVPEEQSSCVSILDELGIALLGVSENQKILWSFPDGERLIQVLRVVYQPEAKGDLYPLCFQ
jgi:regulator of nucleoside diphosphate kinase